MTTPILTPEERHHVETGSWYAKLSPALRQDILSRTIIRRYPDGVQVATRGAPPTDWVGVASGAVRVSSVSMSGKQITLTYVEPGTWFGD
ncbi:MAG: hypothetical protein RLZZ373_1517, partial [Pseudomonadota bacterium]